MHHVDSVEQRVPLYQTLSWVLRPREALSLTDCMWLALLPRMCYPWLRQLWMLSMDTGSFLILNPAERWLLMMLEDNDFSSQPACYRRKNTPTFSFCSVIKHFLVLSSENWSALLWTYRLLHIPSSYQHTSSVGPRLSKNFLFAWEFSQAHHYSHCSALRCLFSETTWPVLHTVFASEVPALAVWDRSTHHHINMLQSCPHSPCFSLLWEVTQQCSGSLCISCGLLNLCGFYSGLPFIHPTLGANVVCIQEVNKQRM